VYDQDSVIPVEKRGSSSVKGTTHLRQQLPALFNKYNIKSMFDAGANDAAWQAQTLVHMIEYHAGERNSAMVDIAKQHSPEIDIVVHDMTQDTFPTVDLLFVRDAAIHMNNFYKRRLITNWLSSSVPWLLITQIDHCVINQDFDQIPGEWHCADVNWKLDPWNFPTPIDWVEDLEPESIQQLAPNQRIQRLMCLWHRDQICQLFE
jgi:hypothetical protein